MLDALLSSTKDIPVSQKKEYIVKIVDTLDQSGKKELGQIIIMGGKKDSLKLCSEGTVVNLDMLSDDIINRMYSFTTKCSK